MTALQEKATLATTVVLVVLILLASGLGWGEFVYIANGQKASQIFELFR